MRYRPPCGTIEVIYAARPLQRTVHQSRAITVRKRSLVAAAFDRLSGGICCF
ncbi:hypothetical protein JYU34_006270 [Plutella xylostella]|uniref:Uncharacterized protein n=1 Tax=Plutella xylostella TaxID=51655 RepID=A0ABQ7QRM2_PLUXY|nr:hypothetical protein JYU34_006270 [Plutella xylostella]